MNIELGREEKLACIIFIFFFAIPLVGLSSGAYLDRLVAYRNNVRRFLGLRDGLFLLLIIPLFLAIEALYRGLVLYKPIEKAKRYSIGLMLLGIVFLGISSYSSPHTSIEFSEPIVHHVIVVTLDGTRADVFRNASASAVNVFKTEGSRAEYGISTYPTITYPSHTTMFTGTTYLKHGVKDNAYYERHAEDLFDILSQNGMKNAIITPAATLASILAGSGYASTDLYTGEEYADMHEVTQKAIELIDEGYSFMRIHYVESDDTGHKFGADSQQYRAVIAAEQQEVIKLIDHIKDLGERDDRVLIITADHGMFVNKHHHIRPQFVDRVPFVIIGGKVKPGELKHKPSTIDIAPTVAMLLGIKVPENAQGVAIGEAFGKPNIRCDVASLKASLFLSSLAFSLLASSSVFYILSRTRFFASSRETSHRKITF